MSAFSIFEVFCGLDLSLSEAIKGPHNSFIDPVLTTASRLGNGGAIWLALALILIIFKRNRQAGLAVCVALFLSLLITNMTLKPLIDRERPCFLEDWCPKDPSFPSGHTTASFAAASAVWFLKEKRLAPLALAMFMLASTIAYSRVFLGVHYPSDCLAGIFVGLICGYWATYLVSILKTNGARHAF